MLRNIDEQQAAGPTRAAQISVSSGSDRGTSHKLIDQTNYLRVTVAPHLRSFAALRMTGFVIRSSSHHFLTSFHRTDSFISERRLSVKTEVSIEYCVV